MDSERQFEHGTITLGAIGKIIAYAARQEEAMAEMRGLITIQTDRLNAALVRIDELEEITDDHDEELFGENKLPELQDSACANLRIVQG